VPSGSARSDRAAPPRLARRTIAIPPEVETRLVSLARAAAPLRRRLARVAGRLLAVRGFERLGFACARDLAKANLQRAHRVFERDGWRCTFPGCTSYGNLQDHHIEYRSHGGSDDLWNRTALCLWHHLRGEHAKILRCRGEAPAKLRFELGVRPGRKPLARYRSGDVLAPA
jgi:hypothetical protein